jgi:ABC-type lipoprotein release transport system permease subunit
LAVAAALARLMASLIWGVGASDPVTFAAVAAALAAVASLAIYLPARHAIRVEPMAALRHE